MSLTSNTNVNCLSDTTNYDPDISAETAMTVDSTYTWANPTATYSWTYTYYGILATGVTLGN